MRRYYDLSVPLQAVPNRPESELPEPKAEAISKSKGNAALWLLFQLASWSVTALIGVVGLLIGLAFVLHWCLRTALRFLVHPRLSAIAPRTAHQ